MTMRTPEDQYFLETEFTRNNMESIVSCDYSHIIGSDEDLDIVMMCLQKNIQPIQTGISFLTSRGHKWEKALQLIDTYSSKSRYFSIEWHERSGSLTINSKLFPNADVIAAKKRQGVLPPLVVLPKKWTTHSNGGYYQHRLPAVLGGKKNAHDGYIALDVLNTLQSIPWKLNHYVLDNYEDKTSYDTDRVNKLSKGFRMENFYFVWQYDKRGRIYSKGYELNFQSTEYHKALLDFAEGEPLNADGVEMLYIALANAAGYDKLTWSERSKKGIQLLAEYTDVDYNVIKEATADDVDEPIMFNKYVRILAEYERDPSVPVYAPINFDCTASGLQILSAITGCLKTARAVNLTRTGEREDVYVAIVEAMNAVLDPANHVDRALVKKPLMTHFYNSKATPAATFNEAQLDAFYKALEGAFSGPTEFMEFVNASWTDRDTYSWTLPDGHTALVRTHVLEEANIKVAEGVEFQYHYGVHAPSGNKNHLPANITHSIDGYLVREVIRRCPFHVATIHDSFWCHPNNAKCMMQVFREVLAELADSDILQDIMRQLTGDYELVIKKESIAEHILESEYALS